MKKKAPILVPDFFAPLGHDLGPGRNPAGLICAANESRFVSGHYSEPLTAYTVGWRDPENLDAQIQRLFPEVPVTPRFSFKSAENAEAFLSETDDLRPSGSPFKRVAYTGHEQEARTYNRGLTVRIDHDDVDDLEAEVQKFVGWLLQRLNRNRLRRGMALLDAGDTNDAVVWDADGKPDTDIRGMGKASADITGIYPNVYAYGELAWHFRLNSYETPNRQDTRRAEMTPEQLRLYLMADAVEIVKARYQSTATVKAAVLAARVYAYLSIQGASKDDPSAVKRFVSRPKSGGGNGVFRVDEEKYTDVSVEHYENMVATGLGISSRDVTEA